jgi:hypothetical protein
MLHAPQLMDSWVVIGPSRRLADVRGTGYPRVPYLRRHNASIVTARRMRGTDIRWQRKGTPRPFTASPGLDQDAEQPDHTVLGDALQACVI